MLYCHKWNAKYANKDRIDHMKTAETINSVCSELGITKADLAKRMGMLPSSLYRKLARESMTLEELQKCLDVLGVTMLPLSSSAATSNVAGMKAVMPSSLLSSSSIQYLPSKEKPLKRRAN